MDCEGAGRLLSRMIFDELEEEQKAEFSEHLAGCPACSEALAAMRRAVYLVREGLEAQTPVLSPERREAVLGETEKPQQAVPGKVKKPQLMRGDRIRLAPKTDRLPLFTGIGAAAAGIVFIIIIGGMFMPSLWKSRDEAMKVSDRVAMRLERKGESWDKSEFEVMRTEESMPMPAKTTSGRLLDAFGLGKAKYPEKPTGYEVAEAKPARRAQSYTGPPRGPGGSDYSRFPAEPPASASRRKGGKDVTIASADTGIDWAEAAPRQPMRPSTVAPAREAVEYRKSGRGGRTSLSIGGGIEILPMYQENINGVDNRVEQKVELTADADMTDSVSAHVGVARSGAYKKMSKGLLAKDAYVKVDELLAESLVTRDGQRQIGYSRRDDGEVSYLALPEDTGYKATLDYDPLYREKRVAEKKTREASKANNVPILGDVPVLGYLFNSRKSESVHAEPREKMARMADEKDRLEKNEIAKRENLANAKAKLGEYKKFARKLKERGVELEGEGRVSAGDERTVVWDDVKKTPVTRELEETKREVKRYEKMLAKVQDTAAPVPDAVTVTREEDMPEKTVFKMVPVNPFVMTKKDRFSTFAIDIDVASYTRTRSYIRKGYLPPAASVRMEEFINAFDYNYPRQTDKVFAVHAKAAPSVFGRALTLIKIGIKGRVLGREGRKPAHLVFVVDASGSMARQDRMPLIKYGLTALIGKLKPRDRVSLVTYGTQARLILEAVPAEKKKQIAAAVRLIQCGGSTNMVEGLALGYSMAGRHFRAGEINCVILCSDGVANVGATDAEQMLKRVETFRNYGITFSSIGFGMGSYNDALLEKLANSGDGTYSFCDSREEARRIFVEKMSAAIQTIAKDAKIQVEFNARRIRRYRLIGYENRDIADDRFRDDTVDAGEVGSGQSATALYEVELLRVKFKGELPEYLGKVYVRYRNADTGEIEEISHRLENNIIRHRSPEKEPRYFLAACAAEFAEILRMSEHAKNGNLAEVQHLLEKIVVKLPLDQRVRELLWMVKRAQGLPRAG